MKCYIIRTNKSISQITAIVDGDSFFEVEEERDRHGRTLYRAKSNPEASLFVQDPGLALRARSFSPTTSQSNSQSNSTERPQTPPLHQSLEGSKNPKPKRRRYPKSKRRRIPTPKRSQPEPSDSGRQTKRSRLAGNVPNSFDLEAPLRVSQPLSPPAERSDSTLLRQDLLSGPPNTEEPEKYSPEDLNKWCEPPEGTDPKELLWKPFVHEKNYEKWTNDPTTLFILKEEYEANGERFEWFCQVYRKLDVDEGMIKRLKLIVAVLSYDICSEEDVSSASKEIQDIARLIRSISKRCKSRIKIDRYTVSYGMLLLHEDIVKYIDHDTTKNTSHATHTQIVQALKHPLLEKAANLPIVTNFVKSLTRYLRSQAVPGFQFANTSAQSGPDAQLADTSAQSGKRHSLPNSRGVSTPSTQQPIPTSDLGVAQEESVAQHEGVAAILMDLGNHTSDRLNPDAIHSEPAETTPPTLQNLNQAMPQFSEVVSPQYLQPNNLNLTDPNTIHFEQPNQNLPPNSIYGNEMETGVRNESFWDFWFYLNESAMEQTLDPNYF